MQSMHTQTKTQSSMITIKVTQHEKEQFRLFADLMGKPLSQLIKELIRKELRNRKITAADIRKLPKESRAALLSQMTEEAMPVYKKYEKELSIEETGDGIE